ncbi:chloride channel protein [Odoribacter sp. OttesenSCG-928-L07]|nr:chloride channel protein [Odoribacter sp. OttesenSCG-928-L07]MDL2239081.1 chloride channel protein [Bacteroidales bacterium OttesenSCG-928-L14]MDL2239994.1 chloride channel protein [Bacteroidales bacterium OttesenSCG-928-K22]
MEKIKFKKIKIIAYLNSLSERQRLIVLAVVVGFSSGLAAVVLKLSIEGIKHLLTNWINTSTASLWYLLLPGIGMFLAMLFVKYIAKEDISHGITKILYSISRKESKLSSKAIWTPLVASAVTIGFGGSVGAEAPIVHSGAAIGSTIAQKLNLNYKHITLLLACGAAGSLAGIFKAPLAGIVFTIEILMFDLTLASIVPLLVSTVTAILIPYFLLGQTVAFANAATPFNLDNIPYYIILGLICGIMSFYFIRATLSIEGKVKKIKNPYMRLIVCALGIGVLVFLFPPLYGEGYSSLSMLLNNEVDSVFDGSIYGSISHNNVFVLLFFMAAMFLKVVSMSFTNAGGGVGGTFGPTLFVGGICGFLVARAINLTNFILLPEANFALVGMGGLMAGVMHAPLTAIFLIAEITGGYDLLMPLMITSAISYMLITRLEPNSIYTKRLAMQGDLITHDKDQAVLTLLKLDELIETDFIKVYEEQTLGDLVKDISNTHRNFFPVVTRDNKFVGVVLLDDVRNIMFDRSKYDTKHVSNFMTYTSNVVNKNDTMDMVMKKFKLSNNTWNLPVVDDENNYLGFISKSKMFGAYREQLINFSQ